MDPRIIVGILAFAVAVIGYLETRFRMKNLSTKVRTEVTADAKLAAAMVLADALVAAAKIKADARVASGNGDH